MRQDAVAQNDDEIAPLAKAGRCPVKGDFARFTLDGVGLETPAVIEIDHMNKLIGEDIGRLHELFIDGDRALVIEVGAGYCGAMDFRFQYRYLHNQNQI